MTEITSNITFETDKITKCVLQIGEKTFTVTLGNSGYEVKEEGTVTVSSASAALDTSTSDKAANDANAAANDANAAANDAKAATSTTSTQPSQEKEYNTQEELIKTLGSYGYTSQ